MTKSHENQTPTEPDQVHLALERTYLAHERTLMAWVRTATSLITFGFSIYKFFAFEAKAKNITVVIENSGHRPLVK